MPDQVDWRIMEESTAAVHAVGRLLRDQREACGLSCADVARNLRIRLPYIEALEEGRFDQLPGAAYIPAFLRTYAAHVGLDPQKVLTAYNLSGAVPIERPVCLPADFPTAEKRAPIGLAVLTILLVVGAGYAVWHYLPRQEAVVSEKVPPVPDRLLTTRPATGEVARAAAPAVVAPGQQTGSEVSAPKSDASAVPASPVRRMPPAQEARSEALMPRPEAPAGPPSAVVAVPAAPPPVMMSAPSVGQALAAQPPVVDTPRPAAADPQEAVVRPAPPETSASALLTATPTKADTKVIVRSNSWVELQSPNGDVLAQTYVRAGESYVVPAGIAYRVIDAR